MPVLYINVLLVQALALASVIIRTISDAPSCGVTYDHHSDDSRGTIHDRNMFIVQATTVE